MSKQGELEELMEIAKRRGFFWPSFSIYGGFSGLNDYGPLGSLLKNKVYERWKRTFASVGGIEIDTPNLTPEVVLKASGHMDKFLDIAAECGSCKNRFKLENILSDAGYEVVPESVEEGERLLSDHVLKCPRCGARLEKVFEFHLMFKTESGSESYFLRPETAQGIFVNFKLLLNYNKGKLPLIVYQQGKGYRNEIAPRQGLIRQREFNMAEAEVFLPEEGSGIFAPSGNREVSLLDKYGKTHTLNLSQAVETSIIKSAEQAFFMELILSFAMDVGIDETRLRFRQHRDDELAHYSSECWDLEFNLQDSWLEITGISDRGTYDLTGHMKKSGENLTYEGNKIARVIEPATGVDRIIVSILLSSMSRRESGYNVMKFPAHMAPYRIAVLPLQKKDGLSEKAQQIFRQLRSLEPYAVYDESGTIGRRYARQDEIGTPYCITVDYETMEKNTVTIRERDSTRQIKNIDVELLFNHPDFLSNPILDQFDSL